MERNCERLLAEAEKLRAHCKAECEKAKRLREQAAQCVAAAAQAMNRAQQLYERKSGIRAPSPNSG